MKSRPAAGAAARALTARVHTPTTGTPRALASTRAVTRPARRPVYGPGPVPTAIASRSVRPRPAEASTRSIIGASSSPRWRAPAAVSPASTRVPSCRATVTAGVAVSNASSSTVAQRRSRGDLPAPDGRPPPASPADPGWGSVNPGQHLVRRGERPGPQRGHRHRPEAAAVLLALHRDGDQHVAVADHDGDLVRSIAAHAEDLERGERTAAEPDGRAQLGLGCLARLERMLQGLKLLVIGVDRAGRGAAVPAGQHARRVRLAAPW